MGTVIRYGAGVILLIVVLTVGLAHAADDSWRPGDEVAVAIACPTEEVMQRALAAYGAGNLEASNSIIASECGRPVTRSGKPVVVPGRLVRQFGGSQCAMPESCVTGWEIMMPKGERVFLALPDGKGPHGGVVA